MKVLLTDGAGSWIVRVDEGDVAPGMEMVRIVDPDLRVSPIRKYGSAMAMMDPDDWRPVLDVPPAKVLEAVRRAPG